MNLPLFSRQLSPITLLPFDLVVFLHDHVSILGSRRQPFGPDYAGVESRGGRADKDGTILEVFEVRVCGTP